MGNHVECNMCARMQCLFYVNEHKSGQQSYLLTPFLRRLLKILTVASVLLSMTVIFLKMG